MDFAEGAGWWTAREDIKDMMVAYRSDQSKTWHSAGVHGGAIGRLLTLHCTALQCDEGRVCVALSEQSFYQDLQSHSSLGICYRAKRPIAYVIHLVARRYESMEGHVDEVRASRGFRYGTEWGNRIQPERKFKADGKMIALWRFEERSDLYRDSSGNGYTLFPGGSLSVSPRGKLTTTWGALKRGPQS